MHCLPKNGGMNLDSDGCFVLLGVVAWLFLTCFEEDSMICPRVAPSAHTERRNAFLHLVKLTIIRSQESEHAVVDQQSYRRPLQRAKALIDRVESMRTQPVPDLEAPNIHTQSPISPPPPASTIPSEGAEEGEEEGKKEEALPSPPSPFMEQPYEQPEPHQAEYKSVQASKLPEIDFTKRFPDPVPGKRLTGTWRYSEHGQDLPADPEYLVSAHAY